ncbi:MAG: hypothetical protein L0Z53_08310 [Acidobacteriales bacterium]|nr:hypothetical protein [Terriglobales bacterium]
MPNWKRALVFGSLGTGAVLLATGRRPAGVVALSVGLVTLATEYPEKFREMWERTPEFMERGNQVVDTISRLAQRIADYRARGAGWREILAEQ